MVRSCVDYLRNAASGLFTAGAPECILALLALLWKVDIVVLYKDDSEARCMLGSVSPPSAMGAAVEETTSGGGRGIYTDPSKIQHQYVEIA